MMVTYFVECNDCNTRYRIRYGVGNNYPQKAAFDCDNCSASIETGFSANESQFVRGATIIPDKKLLSEDIKVVNLYADLPNNVEKINDPFYFQSMETLRRLSIENKDFGEFKKVQRKWTAFYLKWEELSMPLRVLATKGVSELRSVTSMSITDFSRLFSDWILLFIQGKNMTMYDNVCDEYNSNKVNGIKLFFKGSKEKYLRIVYELCRTYMNVGDQLQSSYFHEIYGWEIENGQIPNINWNEIESIYGDLYELVGDLFVLPTMINNLAQGRAFDEFQSEGFTLTKYLKTDKGKRADNFSSNSNLRELSKSYFSWLRNGTHHKNSFLEEGTFEVNLGTGKGGNTNRKITLMNYVASCNQLFIAGLILSSLVIHQMK